MSRYLSMDTEATGLEEHCQLIEVAFIPVDSDTGKLEDELAWECMIQCPPFDEIKPTLNSWVVEHMEDHINKAHREGVSQDEFRKRVLEYLAGEKFKEYFSGRPPVLLGKSMSALDIPMLKRTLGWEFMQTNFHHHTVDVTAVSKALSDSGLLPAGFSSTSKLIKHFGIRDEAEHTAMTDARDMALIYSNLIKLMRELKAPEAK